MPGFFDPDAFIEDLELGDEEAGIIFETENNIEGGAAIGYGVERYFRLLATI